MIRELHVRNIALIEDVHVEFAPGLLVFTGETGAGKSILIGAVSLLLGDRASSEIVRAGAGEADVSGVFELSRTTPALREVLEETGIALEEDSLVIGRRITRHGKNRVHINGSPAPLSVLKRIGEHLVDFQSQHEHQSLLQPDTARVIIDSLPDVAPEAVAYAETWSTYERAAGALREHEKKAANLSATRDILEFQHKELKNLGPKAGEEEEIQGELRLLQSTGRRVEIVSRIVNTLGEQNSAPGAVLARLRKDVEQLAAFDETFAPWVEDITAASRTLSELETFCESYAQDAGAEADPGRTERLNARLAALQRAKKKYGCDLEGLIAKAGRIREDLRALENIEADRRVLESRMHEAEQRCRETGARLSRARHEAGAAFDTAVEEHMRKLGFEGGRWQTAFRDRDVPGADGMEEVEFMVCTNPGEAFLPLAKTASGGEISRLMLAIKTVIAERDHVPVLIFDEVDVGIGGVVARQVASALEQLSTSHQVICISHLHQIASLAHHHYSVYKENREERTVTRIRQLGREEKVGEIARMLGGESEITRKHARQLLRSRSG